MLKNTTQLQFSSYKEPVTNTRPYKNIYLVDAYNAITGTCLKSQTLKLRSISDKRENRKFKATHFPYCTFSGTFEKRNEQSLIQHSGLIAIDFDHLEDVEDTKLKLLKDPYFETEMLFISPNGNGIKWIISIIVHMNKFSHKELFQSIFNYIKEAYSIEIDKACKDISRATFLCYDPSAFIHPKYLIP